MALNSIIYFVPQNNGKTQNWKELCPFNVQKNSSKRYPTEK